MQSNNFFNKMLESIKCIKITPLANNKRMNEQNRSQSSNYEKNEMQDYSINLWCKVYVKTSGVAFEQFIGLLVSRFAMPVKGGDEYYTSFFRGNEIEFEINEDSIGVLSKEEENNPVYFPYAILLMPLKSQPFGEQISFVSELLEYLWSQKWAAAAACNFENRLPREGSYDPTNNAVME